MKKLISIITPTFNSAPQLEECILSVKNQTYKNVEHIIIDGKSRDNTIDIILKYSKRYDVKWISEKDNGIADAMNKGFCTASGEIFGWLDADNSYNLEILEKVSKIFEGNPRLDIVYGNVNIVDEINKSREVNILRPSSDISFQKALIYSTGAIPFQPAVFFKRSIFEEVEGFYSKYKIAGDYDFWLRVLKKEPSIFYLDEVFGNYLKNKKGSSQSAMGVVEGYREMVLICKKNNQPLYGRILLFLKYFKGYILSFIRK